MELAETTRGSCVGDVALVSAKAAGTFKATAPQRSDSPQTVLRPACATVAISRPM